MKKLSPVDKKVLGAMLIAANEDMQVEKMTQNKLADMIGYKASGGILTYSLRILEMNNYITKTGKQAYMVHV